MEALFALIFMLFWLSVGARSLVEFTSSLTFFLPSELVLTLLIRYWVVVTTWKGRGKDLEPWWTC